MTMSRITVAITGASGAIYALRTLRALLMLGKRVDLIVSDFGWMLLRDEGGFEGKRAEFGDFLAERYGEAIEKGEMVLHPHGDLAASISTSDNWTTAPMWPREIISRISRAVVRRGLRT